MPVSRKRTKKKPSRKRRVHKTPEVTLADMMNVMEAIEEIEADKQAAENNTEENNA